MKKEVPKSIKTKKPWPTKAAMKQVYELHLWGGEEGYYSGEGSHHPDIIGPYIETVISFLKSFKKPLTICDLGCGDFNVGKELVAYTQQYIAVDIVPNLIIHNKETFTAENLEFHCLDIATDKLPKGDCAIIRQVFQHLSNTEIHAILEKLKHFAYIILTEHLPEGDFTPNKDIISGQGTRLKKQSGVDVLRSPFHFKIKEEKELLAIVLPNAKGVIKTTLYTLF
ncbi:class I SAM-dependent methyltransferase [uncultured Dokdonia sp.]|uniref:class I SAM-dependent methyltransferase n=1 Tax=uncultured Dokdonia sp. TaxID=575653 RepID=UPI002611392E|nr:class I SAM-dependent methyltransferase [uncultured Dokdonia sp.]